MATVERSRSLYDLTEDWERLEAELVESQGVVTEEWEQREADLNESIQEKAANYRRVLARLEASRNGYESEAKRLKELAAKDQAAIDSLKLRLKNAMEFMGLTKLDTPIGPFNIRKAGGKLPVVLLVDEDSVPRCFTKEVISIDKASLYEALERGDVAATEVAKLGERTTYLKY